MDPVNLQTAVNYVILAKTGISTVPQSAITGDIGVSPIAATAMTGFSLTLDPSGGFSTSTQISGVAFAADYVMLLNWVDWVMTWWYLGSGSSASATAPMTLTVAVLDMQAAYTEAAGRATSSAAKLNVGAGVLGGAYGGRAAPLTPGVYTFGSGVSITSDLHLQGNQDDVFIFQISGVLSLSANTNVVLSGGVRARNVFWQVTGNAVVLAGAHMEGIMLIKTDVLFVTGSSLTGRVLSQTACNLQMAVITEP